MKNLIKSLVVFTLLLSSCKSPIEKNGPQICPSSNFKFTSNQFIINSLVYNSSTKSFDKTQVSSGANIDLSNGGLNIYADFGEIVSWEIKINSKTSSATYSKKDKSAKIDFDWFGQTNELPFFGVEEVNISLIITCIDPINKVVKITNKPTFKHVSKRYGVLIRDWDKNGFFPITGNSPQPADGWRDATVTFEYDSSSPAFAGANKCISLYKKAETKTWYLGGTSFDLKRLDTIVSTNNPDSIYLNVFVKGDYYQNTGVEIGIKVGDDSYMKTGAIDWKGWKLVSVKLSELTVTSGSKAGQKLSELNSNNAAFVINLGANPEQADELKVSYDFIFLSVGKPLFE